MSGWRSPTLLVLVGSLAYANACSAPFVFDDETVVVTNANIRELWSPRAFGAPVQSAVAGRPIVSLSLAVNHALGQLDPWGYHAWNLGIHLLAGLLLYAIIRRTLSNERVPVAVRQASAGLAFAAALLWLVHPLHTEVINYVTQRTESTMGLFYLLTVYAAIRAFSSREHPWRWSLVAVLACAFGMASKESMVTAPIMVLLYDAVFAAGSLKRALSERRWLYTGLAATWVLLAVLVAPGPRWRSAGFASGVSSWTYLLNQPNLILTYLKLAVWPAPLVLDYGMTRPTTVVAVLPATLVVLTLLVGTALAWMKWPALGFLGTWFWMTLAPSSSILPIATEVGAERRMYLPLAAFVVLVVLGVDQLRHRHVAHRRWLAAGALAIVCGAFVWLTVARNREYRSEVGIWQTVLDRRPHGRAHYSLGVALHRTGRISEAIEHYRAALDEAPRAHYALALEFEKMGKHADASREYEAYVRRAPNDVQAPQGYIRLGIVLLEQDRLDEAVSALETGLRMRPQDLDARGALGEALMRQKRHEEAARHYAEHVRLAPNNPLGYENLGLALIAQNREAEAIPQLERAVTLQPDEGRTRLSLGNALATVGRHEEAIVHYRRGIVLVPNSPTLHRMLAAALGRVGQYKEALASLERALALQPDDDQTRAAHAQLSRAIGAVPDPR